MAKMKVIGSSRHVGEYEGRKYDYTTVYAIARQDGSTGTRVGYAGMEMRALPEVFEQVRGLNLTYDGLDCEVTTETMARGKGQYVETVVKVEPIKPTSVIPKVA